MGFKISVQASPGGGAPRRRTNYFRERGGVMAIFQVAVGFRGGQGISAGFAGGGRPPSSYKLFPGAGRSHGDFPSRHRFVYFHGFDGEFYFFGRSLGNFLEFPDCFLLCLAQTMWSWPSFLVSGRGGLPLVLILGAGLSYVGFFPGVDRRGVFLRRGRSPSTRVFSGGGGV